MRKLRFGIAPALFVGWTLLMPLVTCSGQPITDGSTASPTLEPTHTATSQVTSVPTPDIPYWGSTPTSSETLLPDGLDCSKITEAAPGPSWNGLTIGISTFADVQKKLVVPGVWNRKEGHLLFINRHSTSWGVVQACFVGDQLSALNLVARKDLYPDLGDWLMAYGHPDRVTWGIDITNRSLIWNEQGLLVIIDLESELEIRTMMYSPIPDDVLEDSWLWRALSHRPYVHWTEYTPEPREREDPYQFDQ